MKVSQSRDHSAVRINPFSQEDFQADHIFQQHCAESIYHPPWERVSRKCVVCSRQNYMLMHGGESVLRLGLDDKTGQVSYRDLAPVLASNPLSS